jgi:outer membrane protein assembly factor BamB
VWSFTPSFHNPTPSGPFTASPIVVNDTVFIGNGNGYFYALAAATGELLWQFPPGDKPLLGGFDNLRRGIDSPAAYWDRPPNGAVIFAAQDPSLGPFGSARLFALDAKSGTKI